MRYWIVFCGLAVLASGSVHAKPTPVEKEKPAIVFVTPVKKTELFDLLSYPARVEAKINTTVLADADGIISKIHAPLGKKVSRRQRVMTITHTDPVYEYAPVSVTAPVAGIVSLVNVSEGSQVTRGQKLALITDPGKVKLTVEVPAADLPQVSSGMSGEFKVAGSDQKFPVKIRGISPFVDPATGTATAEIEFATKDAIAPGVVGQVTFKANQHSGISIPEHALVYKGSDPFVRLVQGEKAKWVAVQLGRKQRGHVEIMKGLEENASLIERASKHVGDDTAVTVQAPEAK